jgi:hypothetical protein
VGTGLTEKEIEAIVDRRMVSFDMLFQRGDINAEEYVEAITKLHLWSEEQYMLLRKDAA